MMLPGSPRGAVVALLALSSALACDRADRTPAIDPRRPGNFLERLYVSPYLTSDEPVLDLRRTDGDGRPQINRPRTIVLEQGWSGAEPWGTWAIGKRSTLSVIVSGSIPRNLYLDCSPFSAPALDRTQTLAVQVNGKSAGRLELENSWEEYILPLPAGVMREGLNRIEFSYDYARSPAQLGLSEDTRRLAVGFRRIGLTERGRPRKLTDSALELSAGSETLTVNRSGTLIVANPFPHTDSVLDLELTARPRGRRGSSRVAARLWLLDPEADRAELLAVDHRLDGGQEAKLFAGQIPIEARDGCLVFEVEASGAALEIRSSGPAPRAGRRAEVTADLRANDPSPPSDPPDIVVIILDAARADHFGGYGYRRDTTPNIDRLAEESLVFRHALATAPYTACSVPTMITGLSFLEHGMVETKQKLPADIRTLAEYLNETGYLTVGFSGTPNNSVAAGSDQGYDSFTEMWRKADRQEALDPFRLSRHALEFLERDSGDMPLFMMLHYVPPHEPYSPAPRFDLFGAADYRGTANGELRTLHAINHGDLRPTREDLEEIVSLYDGNLRMADEAVEMVLRTLRRRDRWTRTAVLVVSDHGEAFHEHGRMGHNSTVYEEMLRVPFILRLPAGERPSRVDTEMLVSLEDIVPTLLGLAGVRPASELSGRDLLSPSAAEPRALIARTGGEHPTYARRTPGWKVIVNAAHWIPELYDLARDPGERNNLALDRLTTAVCLGRLLDRELNAARVPRSVEPAELSEQDLEALRALGYVQ